MHIWGCLVEARPYRSDERKLDSRIVSCYFIGYPKRSKGYKFYDPTTKAIFETGNAHFFKDIEFAGGDKERDIVFEEKYVNIPLLANDNDQDDLILDNIDQVATSEQNNEIIPPLSKEQTQPPQEIVPLRKSTRERRNMISNEYIVFLQEHEAIIEMMKDDPINLHQAIKSSNSHKWIDAMTKEIKSMKDNNVWDLVSLPEDAKPIS